MLIHIDTQYSIVNIEDHYVEILKIILNQCKFQNLNDSATNLK